MKQATVIDILCLMLLQVLKTAGSKGKMINTLREIITIKSCRDWLVDFFLHTNLVELVLRKKWENSLAAERRMNLFRSWLLSASVLFFSILFKE